MSFPSYPTYKDTGVKWLGKMPAHWKVGRFKQVFRERDERSTRGEDLLLSVSSYTGVTPRSEVVAEGDHLSRADSLEGYKICHPGDLVMNIMLAWNRGLAFTSYNGIVSPAYCVFDVIDNSNTRFLNYLVRSDRCILYFKAFSAGVIDSRLRIYPETFLSLHVTLPPIDEQLRIADFLDKETAKIDALVAKQQRLIELLNEKRQAVISHAVTKGLNPDTPMKPSGIDWIGEIPEHWETLTLKRDLAFLTSGSRGWAENYSDQGDLFIRIANLTRDSVSLNLADVQRVSVPDGVEGSRTKVQVGDVLFSITAYLGSVAVVPELLEDAYVSQHVALARLSQQRFFPHWVGLATLSQVGQVWFETRSYGGTKVQLSLDDVKNVPITAPPLAEQLRIVAYIEDEMAKFASLTSEAEQAITVLKERRAALISAAVTGQIDVRGLVKSRAA